VANRALPRTVLAPDAEAVARQLSSRLGELSSEVAAQLGADAEVDDVERLLGEVVAGYGYMQRAAARQVTLSNRLRQLAPVFVTAPMLDRDVTDLEALEELARLLDAGSTGRLSVA
jgi:hypothetical protein